MEIKRHGDQLETRNIILEVKQGEKLDLKLNPCENKFPFLKPNMHETFQRNTMYNLKCSALLKLSATLKWMVFNWEKLYKSSTVYPLFIQLLNVPCNLLTNQQKA